MKTEQTKANKKYPQNRRKSISFAVRLILASPSNKFASCDAAEIFVKPALRSHWIFTAEPGIEKGVG